MKTLPVTLVAASLTLAAPAQTLLYEESWTVNEPIPDGDANGLVSTRDLTTPLDRIDILFITLEIEGGWPGDLYAYVTHDTGFSVLLNRPGRTTAQPSGWDETVTGLHLTFDDTAMEDIHLAFPAGSPGVLLGEFQPDARATDPFLTVDLAPRSAFLSGFEGLDPDGSWTLFVADVSTGSQATLVSWGVSFAQIPEPGVVSLTLLAASCRLLGRRRSLPGVPRGLRC